MPSRKVTVVSPSRLHFGLLSYGNPDGRQFGGIGMMLDEPGLEISFSLDAATDLESSGLKHVSPVGALADRVKLNATSWFCNRHGGSRVHSGKLSVQVIRSPRLHNGLGTGTQIALAVAAGMELIYTDEDWETIQQRPGSLAKSVDRLGRSSVGTWGFLQGGLIWDGGRTSPDSLGKLERRTCVPEEWRIVLAIATGEGISGDAEKLALASMPPIPEPMTKRLTDLIEDRIFPNAENDNQDDFGEAIYEYGCLASDCFQSPHGGRFATPQIEEWIKRIRQQGYKGVGQSSWGPAIFTFVPNQAAGEEMCEWFRNDVNDSVELIVASPNHHGATIVESE